MTAEELARWRSKHPAFFATFLDDLAWNIRICRAAPSLTIREMGAYVHDLDSLRQVVPHAQALVDEAAIERAIITAEGCRVLDVAVRHARNILALALEIWGPPR
ncbi:MAG: hypothetical protein AMXMBFR33_01810 [Candidatus Xenobia bacterium]